MIRPIKGDVVVSQPFGANDVDYTQFGLKGHHGCDYYTAIGTPVYAPENATVQYSQNGLTDAYTGRRADGEILVLKGTYEHWLMHLSKRLVKAGDKVKEGQLIAHSGNTGFTTGPHLHWGTRPLKPNLDNGYRGFVDPEKVLKEGTNMQYLSGGEALRAGQIMWGVKLSTAQLAAYTQKERGQMLYAMMMDPRATKYISSIAGLNKKLNECKANSAFTPVTETLYRKK